MTTKIMDCNQKASGPLRIAISFVRIPRLFASLFLGPLLVGVFLVSTQIFMLTAHIARQTQDANSIRNRLEQARETHWSRQLMYGDGRAQNTLLCWWKTGTPPPNLDCLISPFDVAIRVKDFNHPLLDGMIKSYTGTTKRIHICERCTATVTFDMTKDEHSIEVYHPFGMLIVALGHMQNSEVIQPLLASIDTQESLKTRMGDLFLKLPTIRRPIEVYVLDNDLVVLVNMVVYIAIALWLALRSHRKVLDYFARSQALLPLVAAFGKRNFYGAIWLLTLLRVVAFLISSVPFGVLLYFKARNLDSSEFSLRLGHTEWLLWIITIIMTFSLLTVLGSVAELKHRAPIRSFCLKYVPMAICAFGAIVWGTIIAFSPYPLFWLTDSITALPILGTLPVILAPVIGFSDNALAFHTLSSLSLLVYVLNKNMRWFAAHLEEI